MVDIITATFARAGPFVGAAASRSWITGEFTGGAAPARRFSVRWDYRTGGGGGGGSVMKQ